MEKDTKRITDERKTNLMQQVHQVGLSHILSKNIR
jgi:hypothetical protein